MKTITYILLLLGPIGCMAQNWDLISPEGEKIQYFGFTPTAHCADSNILWIQDNYSDSWTSYDLMLKITGTAPFDDSLMLLACGSGSYSDGVYKVNVDNGHSEVLFYCYKPETITKIQDKWYVGYNGGVAASDDGLSWNNSLFFHTDTTVIKYFIDDNHHLALCFAPEVNFIYHSNDNGNTWQKYDSIPPVSDAEYDLMNHRLYIAGGNGSYSDGCYVSEDFGATFDNLIFEQGITSLKMVTNETLAIGYGEKDTDPQGVHLLNTYTLETYDKTGNLPSTNVYNLTVNPIINCINLIACTEAGAYLNCNVLSIEDIPYDEDIAVYPNPIKNNLTFEGSLSFSGTLYCKIYDLSGRLATEQKRMINTPEKFSWTIDNLQDIIPGYYTATLSHNGFTIYSQSFIKETK